MDTLVLQIGEKHGRVAEVARSQGGELRVGRAYDNDLILTDHHVAPHQIVLRRSDAGWCLFPLDQTNPVLLNQTRIEGESARLNSGDEITLGRTRLKVYSSEHAVEPTRKLMLSNWLSLESVGLLLPLAVFVIVNLADLVINFYYQSTNLKWLEQTYSILVSAVICLAWAGIWAIAGKIIRHQHHFGLQLIVSCAASLLATFVAMGGALIGFQFSSAVVSEVIGWLVFAIIFIFLFKLNLLIATNIRNTTLAATVMTALLLGVVFAFTYGWEDKDYPTGPEHSVALVPPPLHWSASISSEEYFDRLENEITAAD